MGEAALTVHAGGKDLVEVLEHMLDRARKGELDAVMIAYVQRDGLINNTWAYRDDMKARWAVMLAAAAELHRELLTNGL